MKTKFFAFETKNRRFATKKLGKKKKKKKRKKKKKNNPIFFWQYFVTNTVGICNSYRLVYKNL